MMRTVFVLFACFLFACALIPSAQAQSSSCKVTFNVGPWCSPDCLHSAPPTTVCDNPCIFFCSCSYNMNTCAPAAAASETGGGSCPTDRKQPVPQAGCPIKLATGDTYIGQTDISLPGLGGGLALTRTWNSIWPATQTGAVNFIFGPNWTSTYQERVLFGNDGYMKYARNDGSFWSFGVQATSGSATTYSTTAPMNAGATLTTGATYWTLTFKSGEKRWFDNASGYLTKIIDRNGNATQVAYDAYSRLATVTDPAGRHLYFNYPNPSTSLVSSVTSDFGVSLSYAYDTQGRLARVTKPDNTAVSFQYDSNSNITAVLDSDGKVLESHTYDAFNRGLTSSRANGVDSVTVTYNH